LKSAGTKKKSSIQDLEDQVARKVVSESLGLKKGDSVTVETWNNGFELASKFVLEARKVGAHPVMIFEDEDIYVESVKVTPKDSLGKMGKHEYELLSASDAYFFIPNEALEGYTNRLSPGEVDQATSYGTSWYDAAEKAKLKGARMSFGFAGKELAKILGKKLDEVVIHQLKATLTDFATISKIGKELGARLPSGTHGTIDSDGAELEFEFDDGLRIEDGIVDESDVANGYNMAYLPPGSLSKYVKPASVSGTVKLSPTLTQRGIITGVILEFEKGNLVKWSSTKSSRERLDSLINNQPESQRKLEAVTIGLNPLLRYGYGQDRFVMGAVGISGLDFTGMLRKGTLRAGEDLLVQNGKLQS
jgi:aminopeptidase